MNSKTLRIKIMKTVNAIPQTGLVRRIPGQHRLLTCWFLWMTLLAGLTSAGQLSYTVGRFDDPPVGSCTDPARELCSLRDVIQHVNRLPDDGTVIRVFLPAGTYNLTGEDEAAGMDNSVGDLDIFRNVDIAGETDNLQPQVTIISESSRHFDVAPNKNLRMSGVILSRGKARNAEAAAAGISGSDATRSERPRSGSQGAGGKNGASGGSIHVRSGAGLVMTSCAFIDCRAGNGGAGGNGGQGGSTGVLDFPAAGNGGRGGQGGAGGNGGAISGETDSEISLTKTTFESCHAGDGGDGGDGGAGGESWDRTEAGLGGHGSIGGSGGSGGAIFTLGNLNLNECGFLLCKSGSGGAGGDGGNSHGFIRAGQGAHGAPCGSGGALYVVPQTDMSLDDVIVMACGTGTGGDGGRGGTGFYSDQSGYGGDGGNAFTAGIVIQGASTVGVVCQLNRVLIYSCRQSNPGSGGASDHPNFDADGLKGIQQGAGGLHIILSRDRFMLVRMSRCSILYNEGCNGGLMVSGGMETSRVEIDNSTFSNNRGICGVGAIYHDSDSPLELCHSTILQNHGDEGGSGGIESRAAPPAVQLYHTIVGQNENDDGVTPGENLVGGWISDGYNWIESRHSSGDPERSTDLFGPVSGLGPLTSEYLPVHRIVSSTCRAVNAGQPGRTIDFPVDQVGQPRVLGGRVDIGAVERADRPDIAITGVEPGSPDWIIRYTSNTWPVDLRSWAPGPHLFDPNGVAPDFAAELNGQIRLPIPSFRAESYFFRLNAPVEPVKNFGHPFFEPVWETEEVHPGNGLFNSLAISPSGRPAIAHSSGNGLYFSEFDGTNWSTIRLETRDFPGTYPSLVYRHDGHPFIVYLGEDNALARIRYDGSSWPTRAVARVGTSPSLTLAPDGRLSLATTDPSGALYFYLEQPGGLIFEEFIGTPDHHASICSHAYSPDGRPTIAFYDPVDKKVKLAESSLGSWEISTVADSVNPVTSCSLAFGPDGNPAIAFANQSTMFARFDGSEWTTETVDVNGTFVSMAFDSTGQPAIAYTSSGRPKFARLNLNQWTTSIVDEESTNGAQISLAFGARGQAYISYYDGDSEPGSLIVIPMLKFAVSTFRQIEIAP